MDFHLVACTLIILFTWALLGLYWALRSTRGVWAFTRGTCVVKTQAPNGPSCGEVSGPQYLKETKGLEIGFGLF